MKGINAMLSRRAVVLLAATALGVLGMTGVASAATFTVNDTGDYALLNPADTSCVSTNGGTCTLRAAVQAADNNGGSNTIVVPAGTYKLTIGPSGSSGDPSTGDLDILDGANVTITGAGSGSTIIDANNIDRAFAVQNGGSLALSGMTIRNGTYGTAEGSNYPCYYGECGGAIYSGGALSVTSDVTFSSNTSYYGGAIYSDSDSGSSLSVTGATFSGNGAGYGGAIYNYAPVVATISQSSFSGNFADDGGGAVEDDNGGLSISGSSFSGNAAYDGGAIEEDNFGPLTVTGSSFSGNSAPGEGGAVTDYDASSTTLNNDSFTSNTAYDGGAFYNDANLSDQITLNGDEFNSNKAFYVGVADIEYDQSLTSTGSSFIANSGQYGGVFYIDSGSLSLTNATMSYNSSSNYGGALYFGESTPTTLLNNTIAYNKAPSGEGGGIYETSDIAPSGGVTNTQNTIIAENSGGDCATYTGSSQFPAGTDSGHNLDGDSSCFGGSTATGDKPGVNPLLNTPADNGGSVLTDAETSGSPTIDAGSNTNCPPFDARGVSRPQGNACDMGAYESQAAGLGLSKSAPASATTGVPFNYTITASDAGPGPSTGTTVVDQLPANSTLYGVSASQGSCSAAGSPAKVTCSLGKINNASTASVNLVVGIGQAGTVTNTATATNDEGGNVSAHATTVVASAAASNGSKPVAITGPSNNVKSTKARITGTVKTTSSTVYFLEYGKSKKYGLATILKRLSSTGNVGSTLGNLRPSTVYHYRLVAANTAGTSDGRDRTFRTKGHVFLGSLVLDSTKLHVIGGSVQAPFTCRSSKACTFRFSIVIHAKLSTGQTGTLVFTKSATQLRTIGAHKTVTETVGVQPASLPVLNTSTGSVPGKLTTRPRTNQRGIIKLITLIRG